MTVAAFTLKPVALLAAAIVGILLLAGWWVRSHPETLGRDKALTAALSSITAGKDPDRTLAAGAIRDNYLEIRSSAALWSGVYWGCTFLAAALGALGALILKLETFVENANLKRDLAAACSVFAALLITISSGGDFQRKWQANRVAAAKLEQLGYDYLAADGADSRRYLSAVGRILHEKNMAIATAGDQAKPANAATAPVTPEP